MRYQLWGPPLTFSQAVHTTCLAGYRFCVAGILGPRAVEYCAPESELLAPLGLPVLHSHTLDQAVAVEVVV